MTLPPEPTSTRTVGRVTIVALITAQFFVTLDGSAVTVALPTIRDTLDANAMGLQWTQIAYMLTAAAVALPWGAAGDRLGRRRMLGASLAVFVLGGIVTATAPSIQVLIGGRVLSGAGASGILVLGLGILSGGVPARQVATVVGAWTALSSAASLVAPAFSGWIIETAGWRWVFVAAIIPAMIVTMIVLIDHPPSLGAEADGVDAYGSALLIFATFMIVLGVNQLATADASVPLVLGCVGVGLFAWSLFVRRQRSGRALIDWDIMRRRPVPLLLGLRWALALIFTGVAYQETMLLQNGLGFTPLQAGAFDIPPALAATGAAAGAAWLVRRLGIGVTAGTAFALLALGTLGLGVSDLYNAVPALMVAFVAVGAGFGLAVASLSAGVLTHVPRESQGGGSGLLNLLSQVAAVLGIAVVGALVAGLVAQSWNATGGPECPSDEDLLGDIVAGALDEVGSVCGAPIQALAQQAYLDGITDALLVAAALLMLCAVTAAAGLRRVTVPQ